jgi:hypothetical protein
MRAIVVSLLFLVSSACHASMVWSGVAVDPKLVPRLKSDEKFLVKTLFESPKGDSVHLDKAWHGIPFLLTGSPDLIARALQRQKDEARDYVLQYYRALVAFYGQAAAKGYAVVFALH